MNESAKINPGAGAFHVATLLTGIVAFVGLLTYQRSITSEPDYWSELYSWSQFKWFICASLVYLAGVALLAFSIRAFFAQGRSLARRLISIPAVVFIVVGGFYTYAFLSVLDFKLRT